MWLTPVERFRNQLLNMVDNYAKISNYTGDYTSFKSFLYKACNVKGNNSIINAFIQCLIGNPNSVSDLSVSYLNNDLFVIPKELSEDETSWKLEIIKQLTIKICSRNLLKFESRFPERHYIDKGSFGVVEHSIDSNTGQKYALKRFITKENRNGVFKDALREAASLQVLQSKHIINVIDILTQMQPLIVLEFKQSNLRNAIKSISYENDPLKLKIAEKIINQICDGVKYIHANGFMHRDLKSGNILCNELTMNINVKIADFGLSIKYIEGRCNTLPVCTLFYRAPELLLGYDLYTPSIDIWSIGCIFAELLTGNFLFGMTNSHDHDRNDAILMNKIISLTGNVDIYQELFNYPSKHPKNKFLNFTQTTDVQWPTSYTNRLKCMLDPNPFTRKYDISDIPIKYSKQIYTLKKYEDGDKDDLLDDLNRHLAHDLHLDAAEFSLFLVSKNRDYFIEHKNITSIKCSENWHKHVDLNLNMRIILIEWLMVVCTKLKFSEYGFQLAICILEQYVKKSKNIIMKNLQLIGMTALCIANKVIDMRQILLTDLIFISGNVYTVDELRRCELDMLENIDYNIYHHTLIDFAQYNDSYLYWMLNISMFNPVFMLDFKKTVDICEYIWEKTIKNVKIEIEEIEQVLLSFFLDTLYFEEYIDAFKWLIYRINSDDLNLGIDHITQPKNQCKFEWTKINGDDIKCTIETPNFQESLKQSKNGNYKVNAQCDTGNFFSTTISRSLVVQKFSKLIYDINKNIDSELVKENLNNEFERFGKDMQNKMRKLRDILLLFVSNVINVVLKSNKEISKKFLKSAEKIKSDLQKVQAVGVTDVILSKNEYFKPAQYVMSLLRMKIDAIKNRSVVEQQFNQYL